MLAQSWACFDPGGALDWLIVNADRAGENVFASAASQVAQQDLDLARRYTDRVPPGAKPGWVMAVGQAYAGRDSRAASEWINQYRNDPAYAGAFASVAHQVAVNDDPAAAARMLDGIDWSSQTAKFAAPQVAMQWAMRDPQQARSWVMSMPRGTTRDESLTSYLVASSQTTAVSDRALLGAFSSDQARQQGLMRILTNLVRRAPDQARLLTEQYITDPEMRARAEQMLASPPSPGVRLGTRLGVSNGVIVNGTGIGFWPGASIRASDVK